MNIYIDTEFNEYRGQLISMALVAEDGCEFYEVLECHDPGPWVREHVMPHLMQTPISRDRFTDTLKFYLGQFDSVNIIADWPEDLEHLLHCLIVAPGERIGPDRFTMEVRRDLPDTSSTSRIPHNALEDARALMRSATGVTK